MPLDLNYRLADTTYNRLLLEDKYDVITRVPLTHPVQSPLPQPLPVVILHFHFTNRAMRCGKSVIVAAAATLVLVSTAWSAPSMLMLP
jgi:hypothetical protein